MKTLRKILFGASAFLLSGTMAFSVALPMLGEGTENAPAVSGNAAGTVTEIPAKDLKFDLTQYLDTSVVQKLPEALSSEEEISVILSLDTDTVLDGFNARAEGTVAEFAVSGEGQAISSKIERESYALLTRLQNAGISYELGNRYDTLLGGVEVTIRASAFDALCKAVDGRASVMVGEVYKECETQVVENKVNVYSTGIFDSSGSDYDGTGTVIAVLDTGLDYTHTAFAESRFKGQDVLTAEKVSQVLGKLTASKTSPDITAQALRISKKVPYAYDYADQDDDVSPINSEHGTHVAGIMVGNDIGVNPEGIRGVAPNAQLAVMKVFSESSQGAKTSWLLAALEDCVTLGVDVINMSLGSSCGFSREVDSDQRTAIYDRIKEQGISLITAASNDFNSTYGSEKNGNLPLTGNPDSATVGAPSTYDAALSVASISGVKTPYLLYNGKIVYYTESSNSAAKPKDFVDDILGPNVQSKDFDYVVIPGVGRASDYVQPQSYYSGKIVLVRRGTTNFEEKASIARSYGAAGCIIYNNVSGDISMNVGRLGDYPVCSISKDDGEMLRSGNGKLTISRNQEAGPFMSDFSSWGPSPDLSIKPEITAHGGEIYSSVPGQRYDRLSGTSMAAPNQAGFTALVRQYVKQTFTEIASDPVKVTAAVNQLMMSTADIALNTNGLPFSVRKQGAGLANLTKVTTTPAYLQTFDRETDKIMDKTKIELGDDKDKNGRYSLKFKIVNRSNAPVSYEAGAVVMTEGVSETLTYKGDSTVDQKGYLLSPEIGISSVQGGTQNGSTVTVSAKGEATVVMTVTLSGKDREYLDTSFKNGMYVEGYVKLIASGGTSVDLNAPFLAFYGDWGQAPLFDLDYFATNKDELNDSLETLQKTLPDAFATIPLGGLYNDYIVELGGYPFLQDPASTNKVSADRDRISLSNQIGSEENGQGSVNSIYAIYMGLLRNAKHVTLTITDTVTGEVIFVRNEDNVRKCYNYGGGIAASTFRVEFGLEDYDLKNNTKYQVTVKGEIDYGDGTVANDTFEFPFYTDFTAPVVTGVDYTYEYDRENDKNRLFANVSIYDNHYVQAFMPGYVAWENSTYTLYGFDRYLTPVQGSRNSTTVVQIELTDKLEEIKSKSYSGRSFIIQVMDCASNTAMYEFQIPDDIATIELGDETITINPNEIYNLDPQVFPEQTKAWKESIVYSTTDEKIARVVGGKLIGISTGTVTLTARSSKNPDITDSVQVHVLGEGEVGYNPNLARLRIEPGSFRLTGYDVNKVFYFVASEDRDLGAEEAGDYVLFSSAVQNPSLKMFPSESITLRYDFTAYLAPSEYKVTFSSSRSDVVQVDENGTIVAINEDSNGVPREYERSATVTATLCMLNHSSGKYEPTNYTKSLDITVKVPYTTNGPYLMSYMGRGGSVNVPSSYGFTTINDFAFSNYQLVPKDLAAGDVIDEEDPYYSKQWYIGENTITEVTLPEGVESIGMYAFAGLTRLRKITLPSTLTKIQTGAFLGCTALTDVVFSGKNNLQFINTRAFENCTALINFEFDSLISVGDSAFKNSGLVSARFTDKTQSIGAEAFAGCTKLATVTIAASKVRVGAGAFSGDTKLKSLNINASVLPAELIRDCSALTKLTIGPDVEVLGQFLFKGTGIRTIEVDPRNQYFDLKTANGTQYIVEKQNPQKLVLVSPSATSLTATGITEIATGAFSSAASISTVELKDVTAVGDYAFAECSSLRTLTLGTLKQVGKYAFYSSGIRTMPALAQNAEVGERAFARTSVSSVDVKEGSAIGDYAFAQNASLTSVTIGDNVTLGEGAFFADYTLATVEIGDNATLGLGAFSALTYSQLRPGYMPYTGNSRTFGGETYNSVYDPYISALSSLTIGENATIGDYAFQGAGSVVISASSGPAYGGELTSVQLGNGAKIGNYAFFDCHNLTDIDLRNAVSIGDFAFGGMIEEYIVINSSLALWGYMPFAPMIEEAELTAVKSVSEGVFSGAIALSRVTLSDDLTAIPAMAFANCISLKDIDLSKVVSVGDGAFLGAGIETVTLAEGARVGESAFSGCSLLTDINLSDVSYIGAEAFSGTGLQTADLTSAQTVGDFAFVGSDVTSVVLGDRLQTIGENPFAGCEIPAFSKDGQESFEAGRAKVIEGVLYSSCPNGYELVCYPLGKKGELTYRVASGTVRIGAEAFYLSDISTVSLAREVKAIGDRAFYGCENLIAVLFASVDAPILEESYLSSYETEADERGVPAYMSDAIGGYVVHYVSGTEEELGLKIVDFQMWIADPTNVLHGANFIDRIGSREGREAQLAHKLIMVRPINGVGYETFIYRQYFDVFMDGAAAANEDAVEVMRLIDGLPDASNITIADKPQVEAVRALYDRLSIEQKSTVTNYQRLTAAEDTIGYLEQQQQPTPPPHTEHVDADNDGYCDVCNEKMPESEPSQPAEEDGCGSAVGMSAAIVALFGAAVLLRKKRSGSSGREND